MIKSKNILLAVLVTFGFCGVTAAESVDSIDHLAKFEAKLEASVVAKANTALNSSESENVYYTAIEDSLSSSLDRLTVAAPPVVLWAEIARLINSAWEKADS